MVVKGAVADAEGDALKAEFVAAVSHSIGPIARPGVLHIVPALPKTRSGKVLRRALQAVCEGRDPGDLSTIEDRSALDRIVEVMGA